MKTILRLAAAALACPGTALAEDAASLVRAYVGAPHEAARRQVLDRIRASGLPAGDIARVLRAGDDLDLVPAGVHRLSVAIREDGSPSDYLLCVPPDYHPRRPWPLLVSMHGTGGRGEHCLELWRRLAREAGFLLACPTATVFREKGWGSSALERSQIVSVIADVSRRCHVDSDRVYLGGWSMGGHGTFDVGVHHADRFAALNPAIGRLSIGLFGLAANLETVPIFFVSGAQDQEELVDHQRETAAFLEKRAVSIVHREHAEGGHEFFPEDLPDVAAWLRRHARERLPARVRWLVNDARYGRAAWLRVDALTSEARAPDEAVRLRRSAKLSEAETRRRYVEALEKTAARIEGRRVDATRVAVTTRFVARYTLLVLDGLLGLDRTISVTTNGKRSFYGKVAEDPAVLLGDFLRTGDRSRLVVAEVPVEVAGAAAR